MTGIHLIQFVKDGKVVEEMKIEAIQLSPHFSGAKRGCSVQNKIYDFVCLAKPEDCVVIKTELEE